MTYKPNHKAPHGPLPLPHFHIRITSIHHPQFPFTTPTPTQADSQTEFTLFTKMPQATFKNRHVQQTTLPLPQQPLRAEYPLYYHLLSLTSIVSSPDFPTKTSVATCQTNLKLKSFHCIFQNNKLANNSSKRNCHIEKTSTILKFCSYALSVQNCIED